MSITDSQKTIVTQWVKEGKALADIQRLLREEFSISITYMDVRFLVDDIGAVYEEPEPEVSEDDEHSTEEATVEDPELVDGPGSGGVAVDVDAIMRPGAVVSGTVTFSDGASLGWQLSGEGQLGLIPGDNPDYRPSPEDVESFQMQLEEVLRKKGF